MLSGVDMRYLMFKLGMPRTNSWNNNYSGESRNYLRIVRLYDRSAATKIETEERIKKLSGYYYHDFGDGWGASVTVQEVDQADVKKLEKSSDGFDGYDWMIKSILNHGEIRDTE